MKLTYRELLAMLNKLTPEMLDDDVMIFNGDTEEFCVINDVDVYPRDDMGIAGTLTGDMLVISIATESDELPD